MKEYPIVGISGSILSDQSGSFAGYRRAYVNYDYCTSVINNGGVPFILPVTTQTAVLEKQIEQIDALILSGGQDIFPQYYGQEPLQKLGETFPERDQFEFKLIELTLKKEIPILAICRGFQLLNVYFGGTLYQDLSYIDNDKEILKHSQEQHPTLQTHSVVIDPTSKLYTIIGQETFLVNSFHHQCVKTIGNSLRLVAHAADNVPEAVEKDDYPFLLGIQWHPEMLSNTVPYMSSIFKSFINSAK